MAERASLGPSVVVLQPGQMTEEMVEAVAQKRAEMEKQKNQAPGRRAGGQQDQNGGDSDALRAENERLKAELAKAQAGSGQSKGQAAPTAPQSQSQSKAEK